MKVSGGAGMSEASIAETDTADTAGTPAESLAETDVAGIPQESGTETDVVGAPGESSETPDTSDLEPSDSESESDDALFYTIPTPEGYIFGLYEWNSKILLYTYEGDAYRLTLVDPEDGSVIAQTQEDFQGTLWIGFSEPLTEVPAKSNESRGVDLLPETGESETPDSGLIPALPETPGILIDDGIFNSGEATDAPTDNDLPTKGDAATEPAEANALGGANGQGAATAQPAAPSLQLRIFDSTGNRFLWLDDTLTVVDSYEMPEQVSYQPQMDESNQYIYYVNLNGEVIQLERQTGAMRTYETSMKLYSQPNLEGLYDDGQLLVVSGLAETEGGDSVVFIQNYMDVATGAQLYQSKSFSSLTGAGGQYVMTMSGDITRVVTGTFEAGTDDARIGDAGTDNAGADPGELIFEYYDEYQSIFSFPESGRTVTFHSEPLADGSLRGMLSVYSLDNGHKTAACEIPAEAGNGVNLRPLYMVWLPETEQLVFAVSNESGQLCVWNLDHPESQSGDNGIYKRPVMAADDSAELSRLKSMADTMSRQYDIEIYVGEDCPTQLFGYRAQRMTDVPVIQRALMILNQALERYPDGFFTQLANERQGRLKFYILGNFFPDDGDSLETTVGLFTQEDSQQYISLNALNPDQMESLIYHEVTHAIDNKLFGISNQTYHSPQWDALNPPGFSYDFNYQDNARQPGRDYIYGMSLYSENPTEAYFIDNYSRSYPTEDWARIMEYAMGRYPWENCFTETHLRDKLDYISRDIRYNFDTSRWPEITWWERALSY